MLGLKLATDPRWVNIAEKNIGDILIDHAYCEQKAASSCISLIVRHPEKEKLVEALTPIVSEEWAHFRMVLRELKKRNIPLGKPRKDEYVIKLKLLIRKNVPQDLQFLDQMLINALIEELKQFYHDLMASEAGHYVNFVELAKAYLPEEVVKNRLEELLEAEARIIESMDIRSDRMH
jgi:tRNA 2-(methylsulfanyl)-N6-isopentenyladenosine37 hydroxylase